VYAVQLHEPAYDLDVADRGDVEQPARRVTQQRGDHGFRYEVLGSAYPDLAV
jgi:hypothetical protein